MSVSSLIKTCLRLWNFCNFCNFQHVIYSFTLISFLRVLGGGRSTALYPFPPPSNMHIDDFSLHVAQAEPLSYVGPGEIIGIGVLAFVIILLLILFVAFRKKIKFRKDSDPGPGTQAVMGVSAISTETSYMLHKTGMGAEGIEFKAVRVSGSPGATSTYGEVGGSTGGPPQVMVRPTTHSPLPGGLGNQGMRSGDGDKTTSSEGSQVWAFIND